MKGIYIYDSPAGKMSKSFGRKYRLIWQTAKILYDREAEHGDCGLWMGEPCRIVARRGNSGRMGLCIAKPLPPSRVRISSNGTVEIHIRQYPLKERRTE